MSASVPSVKADVNGLRLLTSASVYGVHGEQHSSQAAPGSSSILFLKHFTRSAVDFVENVGDVVGWPDGRCEKVGASVGWPDGWPEGWPDGWPEGWPDGWPEG